jgi:hypothetical protein
MFHHAIVLILVLSSGCLASSESHRTSSGDLPLLSKVSSPTYADAKSGDVHVKGASSFRGNEREAGSLLSSEPSVVSLADQATMLSMHNIERANVSPPAAPPLPILTWSEKDALQAKTLAESCVFNHDRGGQNLAARGTWGFRGGAEEGSTIIAGNVSLSISV